MNDTEVREIGGEPVRVALDGRPVIVGEVLFDVFPDGTRVLGGAPFNVAWHLQAFGLEPLMVTRIGDDAFGEQVVGAMERWGMDVAGLQHDDAAPTGRVQVELDDGAPTFEILEDQAYDRLDASDAVAAIADLDAALLYHGSLIARTSSGRSVLDALRRHVHAPAFVDVNLRDPWWQPEGVRPLLDEARWVKLNEQELGQLVAEPVAGDGAKGPELAAAELAERHRVEHVVVTCGDRGAFVLADGRSTAGRPPEAVDVVDTVGAGDAFSSVWITGVMRGWAPQTTLVRALDFAAVVCGVRGATTSDRRMYERELDSWEAP